MRAFYHSTLIDRETSRVRTRFAAVTMLAVLNEEVLAVGRALLEELDEAFAARVEAVLTAMPQAKRQDFCMALRLFASPNHPWGRRCGTRVSTTTMARATSSS